MAKASKGGLGRGLNSLLGGSFEEAVAPDPVPATAQPQASHQNPTPAVPRTLITENPEDIEKIEPVLREVHRPADISVPVVEKQAPESLSEAILRTGTGEVPIEQVNPNPDQPRTNFNKDELEELAASIKLNGLLQPILVRPVGTDSYQIIAGERRWQASKQCGLTRVPIRIKEADDEKVLELALIENIQRSDLNPIEEAYGYRRMMERQNMTQSDIAKAMSKGRSTVANALRLLELPEDAQQLLYEEKITAGHARAILSIPTKEGRQKLTEKLVQDKLSVREAEAIARLMSGKKSEGTTQREPIPKEYRKVAKALKEALHTNVKVKSSKGKNKLEIEFTDQQDLERLFEELVAATS